MAGIRLGCINKSGFSAHREAKLSRLQLEVAFEALPLSRGLKSWAGDFGVGKLLHPVVKCEPGRVLRTLRRIWANNRIWPSSDAMQVGKIGLVQDHSFVSFHQASSDGVQVGLMVPRPLRGQSRLAGDSVHFDHSCSVRSFFASLAVRRSPPPSAMFPLPLLYLGFFQISDSLSVWSRTPLDPVLCCQPAPTRSSLCQQLPFLLLRE